MKTYFVFAVVEQRTSKKPCLEGRVLNILSASRGARHGIKMSGKLQRLQEQEERSAASHLLSVIEPVLEKKKKEKKRKIPETDE